MLPWHDTPLWEAVKICYNYYLLIPDYKTFLDFLPLDYECLEQPLHHIQPLQQNLQNLASKKAQKNYCKTAGLIVRAKEPIKHQTMKSPYMLK